MSKTTKIASLGISLHMMIAELDYAVWVPRALLAWGSSHIRKFVLWEFGRSALALWGFEGILASVFLNSGLMNTAVFFFFFFFNLGMPEGEKKRLGLGLGI